MSLRAFEPYTGAFQGLLDRYGFQADAPRHPWIDTSSADLESVPGFRLADTDPLIPGSIVPGMRLAHLPTVPGMRLASEDEGASFAPSPESSTRPVVASTSRFAGQPFMGQPRVRIAQMANAPTSDFATDAVGYDVGSDQLDRPALHGLVDRQTIENGLNAARHYGQVMAAPYVGFYRNSVVDPFYRALDAIARSPLGDPGLYASLQGLGRRGRCRHRSVRPLRRAFGACRATQERPAHPMGRGLLPRKDGRS